MASVKVSASAPERHGVSELPRRALIGLIELYRTWISPVRPPTCRFVPTCSEYAVEALQTHGVLRGLVLAMIRLLKCGPWHRGGWDPVPERSCGHRPPGPPTGDPAVPESQG
ncbi:membrane protein insertion efficiency factor YidD [Tsukamurella sp. 8F]|uniref:membrane protein insertion efficiency factor YidD n=1 Tax=unclassified Tsukamurella TaxID=2633480 RepID=UPI0023B99457|nr:MULTISPECIES: membrane protein insertion efficiency factor YidD [unclassified Tsukamurella]MDF0529404.1 membrane protein insertion efficiency factor YidD [Tsukamurella sp. 8J]MDF0587089.1 membrane protein insertion efficiency factor YidD [Tsukamurella sp. 8F]